MAPWAAGLRAVRHYVWLQTLVLLLSQLVTSHVCRSLISMTDGFHTLYIFMHMSVFLHTRHGTDDGTTESAPMSPATSPPTSPPRSPPRSPPTSFITPPTPDSAPASNASPSVAESGRHHAALATATGGGSTPTPAHCGLSYPEMRSRSVEVFSSALCLATLCGTYFLEVLPQIAEPTEKRFPLVSTVVGALSVLHNALVLGLTRARLLEGGAGPGGRPDHEAIGRAETGGDGGAPAGAGRAGAKARRAAANWAESLVFSNPGAHDAPDPDTRGARQAAGEDPGTPVHGEPPGHGKEPPSVSGEQGPSSRSGEYADRGAYERRGRDRLLAAAAAFPALFPAVLAVIHGLVLMLLAPECVPASLGCTSLVHLDVAFSMLAMAVLLISVVPQVYRYGLLLLQASPAHVSVAELKVEISRIPGVQSLHDFHIWQLTETRSVASVHVRCQDGFQKHRCGDLIAAVTKVIHGVGITCCTIQPEFPPPAVSSGLGPAPPDGPPGSPPAGQAGACALACGAACQEKMCCSPREEL